FAAAAVDVAVVEVGLGGRLDSTNVLRPVAAGVTSIGLDHAEWLGSALDAIAREKGGIYKPGVPAVVGELDPEIRELLAAQARGVGAAPVRVLADECEVGEVQVDGGGTTFGVRWRGERGRLRTPLAGRYQAQNTLTALLMLDAAGPRYAASLAEAGGALAGVRLAGRYQRHGRYLFDVAHNPAGVATLVETLDQVDTPRPLVLLTAILSDKPWREMLEPLLAVADGVILTTAPSAPESRRWDPAETAEWVVSETGTRPRVIDNLEAALQRAETLAPHGTILVTGSVHTVGDVMAVLGVEVG
ncbi:MAG: dihydrofolate synthase, partial [Gemmatimonadetes bacterium]|nr:dihydrofolate synthase [Gemmatimonadota bacterium]